MREVRYNRNNDFWLPLEKYGESDIGTKTVAFCARTVIHSCLRTYVYQSWLDFDKYYNNYINML